jgi:hypothetical protein
MRTDVYALDIETKSRFTDYGETCPWLGQIVGIGLAWGGDIETDSAYYLPESFDEVLEWLHREQIPLVPYNALFEVTWLTYYYPQYKLNWVGDAALYAIALDNSASSFGLKDASGRLVNYEPYEQEYQLYCIENFKVAAKKWGSCIPMMPYEKISRYCRHDCTATWLIWQRGCRELNIDVVMEFFMAEVYMTSEAYTIGTKINVELSQELFDSYYFKFKNAGNEFMQHPELIPHIEIAQRARYEKKLAADLAKSITGKVRPPTFEKWSANPKNQFNPGSDDQLRAVFKSQKLFWDEKKEMFIYPELTEGGVASMAEDYIHLYGVGGEILSESKTNKTKAAKFSNILTDSTYDNRCHFDINLCSVRSTRVSSKGLNIVATSLDDDIGECFIADDGWEFVLWDVNSLEPTVAAILTDDKMLRYCAYFGEGIKPYYKDGVLHVDDTYLCYLSKTKRWREEIMDQFNCEEWMDDPEAVKKKFKKIRQAGKKIVLMTGYGSGVPKVCSSIFKELKIRIGIDEGRELVNVLWAVFPDMWRFICRLRAAANTGRSIPTWLQFPISTNQSVVHCVYNYRCQTEAAHVTKQMIWQMWQRKQDWWVPAVPNIHDANACLVKTSYKPEFKFLLQDSLKDLNDTLAPFTKGIQFRISVHTGKTLREAKEG